LQHTLSMVPFVVIVAYDPNFSVWPVVPITYRHIQVLNPSPRVPSPPVTKYYQSVALART